MEVSWGNRVLDVEISICKLVNDNPICRKDLPLMGGRINDVIVQLQSTFNLACIQPCANLEMKAVSITKKRI